MIMLEHVKKCRIEIAVNEQVLCIYT